MIACRVSWKARRYNTGGAIFDDIECGSFNIGFRFGSIPSEDMEGALDTVEMRNCRVWPYQFSGVPALKAIYDDGETIGFRIGQVDDLKMTNITPFRARIIFEPTLNPKTNLDEVPFGTIQGLALDGTGSSIDMQGGEIAISSMYATTDGVNDTFISMSGGNLALSDFSFENGTNSAAPMVHLTNNAAICLMQNGRASIGANPNAQGFRVDQGKLTVSSVRFQLRGGLADVPVRSQACITQSDIGQLTAYGNMANGPVTGQSGPFIRVGSNRNNVIMGNHSSGWSFEFPPTRTNGVYALNHNGSTVLNG